MTLKEVLARVISLLSQYVQVEKVCGEPFIVAGRKLIPTSQTIRVGGVGKAGGLGFVWNRPTAVTEEIGDGIYRHYAIRDETLRAIIGIAVAALALRLVLGIVVRRK